MYKELLAKYPIISDQIEPAELAIILEQLEHNIDQDVPGDVVEFGCYVGTTSLFLQRMLIAKKSDKKLFVYDSFDGLPEKTKEDISPLGTDFRRGELKTSKAQFIHNFRRAGLPLPKIVKGWFHEVRPEQMPASISFAFLDGDYYKSIRSSLDLVIPLLAPGGVIIVDDYSNSALPGAKRAASDTLKTELYTTSSLGIYKL